MDADVNLPIALTECEIRNLQPMEEARCTGSGALIEAARSGNAEMVKLLLNSGAFDYENKALAVAIKVLVRIIYCYVWLFFGKCPLMFFVQENERVGLNVLYPFYLNFLNTLALLNCLVVLVRNSSLSFKIKNEGNVHKLFLRIDITS